jgi:hypothetical protein
MRERLGIAVRGFGDMNAEEVASLTGLTIEEARLAKQQDYAEPFIFPDRSFLVPPGRYCRELHKITSADTRSKGAILLQFAQ